LIFRVGHAPARPQQEVRHRPHRAAARDGDAVVAAHTFALNGQKVAYAKFTGGNASDTAHEAQDMTFGGLPRSRATRSRRGRGGSSPRMVASKVRLQAAEQIAGGSLAKRPGHRVFTRRT
jgi:hypothetical protein